MNGQLNAVQPRNFVTVLALALLLITGGALAQVPVDENGNPIGTWSGESERPGLAAFAAAGRVRPAQPGRRALFNRRSAQLDL